MRDLAGCKLTNVGGLTASQAPRPPVSEATRWDTQTEMRSSDVEKYRNLVLSVFSHLWFWHRKLMTQYTCVWGYNVTAHPQLETLNAYLDEKPMAWLCLLADLCKCILYMYIVRGNNCDICVQIHTLCRSIFPLSLSPLSLYPLSLYPLWMRKWPRVSLSSILAVTPGHTVVAKSITYFAQFLAVQNLVTHSLSHWLLILPYKEQF